MKHFILGFLVGAAIVFLMLYADACQRRERAAMRKEARKNAVIDEPIAQIWREHKRNGSGKTHSVSDIDNMFPGSES